MGTCSRIAAITFECVLFAITAVVLWAVYDDLATDSLRRSYEERLLHRLIEKEAADYSAPLGATVSGRGDETPRLLFKHTDTSSPSVEGASLCQSQTATYTVTERYVQEVSLDHASLESRTAYAMYYQELLNELDKKSLYQMMYSGTYSMDAENMSRGTGLVYLVNKDGTEYTVTNPLNADDLVRLGWTMLEHITDKHVCEACKGKGKIEDETCWHCDGYCIDPVKE